MKVLKNILKWILCVFLTFTTVFTINVLYSGEWVEGALFKLNTTKYEKELNEHADEIAAHYEETVKNFFNPDDELNESENEDRFLSKQFKKYPLGTVFLLEEFAMSYGIGSSILYSSVVALILGTAIFFLINSKEKKGIKFVIITYIISIILLGYILGIEYRTEQLKMSFAWTFPSDYIIPLTVAFGLVILVRIIKQKDLAEKLNKKLKEKTNRT